MQYTLFMILAPLAAVTSIAIAVYSWRHRTAPGALALMWTMIAVTGWLILNTLELADPTESGTVLWAKLEYPFIALAPVPWLVFALQYAGRDKWLTPMRIVLLCVVPLMISFFALTNDWHHLIWKSYVFTPVNHWLAMNVLIYGPWFWVHVAYSYVLIFVGAFVIVREYFISRKLYRQQSFWTVAGVLVPIVFNIVYVFHLIPGFRKDYSSVTFALSGLAFSIAILRYHLFDLKPVARDALVESMRDGMLVLDEQDRIVDLNRATEDILGISVATAIGRPAGQVLSPWQDLVDRFGNLLEAQAEISLKRGETQRYYDSRISPLRDRQGHFSGRLVILRDITRRKQVELALRESEERMRQMTSSMREAVWLRDTRTLEVLYVNPAYEEIWGRSCESLYKNPTSFLDAVHSDDKARIMEAIQKQYQGVPFDQEYRIIRPDGSLRWIWGRTFFIKNEAGETYRVTAIAEDITERKQMIEALRENESRLRALAHALPDLVFVFDRDGRYLEVPETQPDLVLRPEQRQVQGCLLHEVLPKDVADNFMSAIHRTFETGQSQSLEYQLDVPAGRRWFEGRTAPMLDTEGHVRLVVWGARDITERKEVEQALRRANLELEARNEELDTFGHTVAHDLKNPLSTIVGYANTLVDLGDTLSAEELSRAAQTIAQVGMKMDSIIEELMLLSGLRAVQVEMGPLEMTGILTGVKQRLDLMIQRHHAEVIWPSTSAWPMVLGYGPWVEQVWVNYLTNAIKYGGTPAAAPCVEIGAVPASDGMARFWVRDNGPGLSPEAQARLFIPFERLSQMRVTGHGLGLSIVRRIVEKMGGQVSVKSDGVPGHGSTFYFTLPLAAPRRNHE